MASKRTPTSEVWMQLSERGRKRLATLMVIQDKSQRDVARAAGWSSHSYLGRLLRGEVETLEPEPALRIARYFGVGVDDLFVVRVSSSTGVSDQSKVGAA
jgi:transcriptional regulator with XRE-family HTH domain